MFSKNMMRKYYLYPLFFGLVVFITYNTFHKIPISFNKPIVLTDTSDISHSSFEIFANSINKISDSVKQALASNKYYNLSYFGVDETMFATQADFGDICVEQFKQNYTLYNGVFIDKSVNISTLPQDFDYIINPKSMCYTTVNNALTPFDPTSNNIARDYIGSIPTNVFIISMIHTAPKHYDLRDSIRETWGSVRNYFNLNLRLVFILGSTNDTSVQSHIANESLIYNDIVQFSFHDAYNNLTYKMAMGYKWISHYCPHAEFILKMDDDIYVDIFQVITSLTNFKNRYGAFLRNKIDELRPPSQIFPYTYNQTQVWPITQFPYIMYGDHLSKFLKLEEEAANNSTAAIVNTGYDRNTSNSSLTINNTCDPLKYHMLNTDSDLIKEYISLFGPNPSHLRDIIMCPMKINTEVFRSSDSKWFTTVEQYPSKFYEPYCSGWSIILTPPVAFKLYKAYFTQPYFYIDDAHVTGKLARIAGTLMITLDHTVEFTSHSLEKWVSEDPFAFVNGM